MKNDFQFAPQGKETMAEFLVLVSRTTYRARFVTSHAIHVAEAGEWEIEVRGETVVVSFLRGRILDSQNRGWVAEKLSIRPVDIVIPYGYPVFISSLRYYVQFPHACSLTLESAVSINPR